MSTERTDDVTDLEFIRGLRKSVNDYLRAVDEWEASYNRFYRLRTAHRVVTPDLERAQSEYVRARSELTCRVPRARRVCTKFDVRDPLPGLMRVELGEHSPQVQQGSAVGRNERAAIAESLAELEARCVESEHRVGENAADRPQAAGVLKRIRDFFV
jgi:hypothetical protein